MAVGIWLVFYPALLSPDSIAQVEQALQRQFDDWNPPIMAMVLSGVFALGGHLALLMLAAGALRAERVRRRTAIRAARRGHDGEVLWGIPCMLMAALHGARQVESRQEAGRPGAGGAASQWPIAARWTTKHAVLSVFVVAVLVRVWALGSIPLIITNDSTGYLGNAQQLAYGQELKIELVRTPGYPLFLAGILKLFGRSPTAVLMGNHLLGALMCVLITWTAARLVRPARWPRAGPRLATIAGLLAALDPWLLGMESYALTEAISAFLMALAFALATAERPRSGWLMALWGLWLGLTLGYACLVRPTFQVIVPFMAMGWAWNVAWREPAQGKSGRGIIQLIRHAAVPLACVALGFAAPTVPWLAYNHQRGVDAFARGGDTLFVAGLARAGLLDESYPALSEQHRAAYAELKPLPWKEDRIFAFLAKADAWDNAESRRALLEWAKYSIVRDIRRYVGAMGYALLWQLNRFPSRAPIKGNETAGFIGLLGEDGTKPPYAFAQPNFYFDASDCDMTPYAMRAPQGPLAEFDRWMKQTYVSKPWTQGLPQMVLFMFAVWTGLVCLWRKRTWGLALAIAGTGAFFAVHVVMVLPFSRYGLPAWAAWYVMLALAGPMTVEAVRRRRGRADLYDEARASQSADASAAAKIEARPEVSPSGLADSGVEVSFVMPCLNEAQTIGRCVRAAMKCLRDHDLAGEVVVGDNGSEDGSQALALAEGARVVAVPVRGYGAALHGAITAARGKYIIMGDSDLQHDFADCYGFVEKLREGYDLVMGSRRLGRIMPGAMKWMNRYIGAPVLSMAGRFLFRAPISDFHCGLRAFTKQAYESLPIRTTGMEFASEHIIKSALAGHRMTEIPITVHPDGRDRPPHLNPWRDGWRHLRFMLLLSPRWTLTIPGLILMIVGLLLGSIVALSEGPVVIAGVGFDVHTLALTALMVIVGYTAFTVGVAARIFAVQEELGPPDPRLQQAFSYFTLERGILAGAVLFGLGAVLLGALVWRALSVGIRPDEVTTTMRPMIVGATLVAVGVQTVLMSFFYSMLGIQHKK